MPKYARELTVTLRVEGEYENSLAAAKGLRLDDLDERVTRVLGDAEYEILDEHGVWTSADDEIHDALNVLEEAS